MTSALLRILTCAYYFKKGVFCLNHQAMQGGILLLVPRKRYQNKKEGILKTINLVRRLYVFSFSKHKAKSFFPLILRSASSRSRCRFCSGTTPGPHWPHPCSWCSTVTSSVSLKHKHKILQFFNLWPVQYHNFGSLRTGTGTTRGSLTPLGSILEVD